MDNNYSHPDIPEILNQEGNSVCVDCGSEKPKWASMNNGVFLCLKCAGIHRGFGMSISLIRSLQIDSWTEKQLLYLTKGGNKNFKNNLSEFNIAETAALDIKYKSKAADYYRKYLKNEVDREGDPNYVPTQIVKPDIEVAMDIIDIKEETEEKKEKPEEKDKQIKKKFFGFMNNILTKVKEGTSGAAKKV
jgi:ADP-ribosylation factor GTPase-activating protein 1